MKYKLITVTLASIALLAACSGSPESSSAPTVDASSPADASEGSSEESFDMYMLPKFVGIAPFDEARRGAEDAAAELGHTVSYGGPTKADVQEQVQFLQTVVAQKPDVILLSALDAEALVPALTAAAEEGIDTVTFDSDVNPAARLAFASAPDAGVVGSDLVRLLGDQIDYEGQFVILSGAATSTNQNTWIEKMQEAMAADPKYANMEIVEIIYGNDDDAKSFQDTLDALKAYPDLKGIIAPTTVGVAAAARALEGAERCDVKLTGLGLPSQMKASIKSGCVKNVALWSFYDEGYLAVYLAHAIKSGSLDPQPGATFEAGKLGTVTIGPDGTTPIAEELLVFDQTNVDEYDF